LTRMKVWSLVIFDSRPEEEMAVTVP